MAQNAPHGSSSEWAVEPTELATFRDTVRTVLGSAATESFDPRRGFSLLQWPCPWDTEKPFELSLEHEVRLKPAARGSETAMMAALELCDKRSASTFLPHCEPLADLLLQAVQRPTGAQSVDLYYDVTTDRDKSLIWRRFTVRERLQAARFMTWGSAGGRLRPMNAELPSSHLGQHGLTARLEFNWRERNAAAFETSQFHHHPLRLLANSSGTEPGELRPVLRHTTVRRKFNLVTDDEAAERFVINVDVIRSELIDEDQFGCYVDIDVSALHPVSESVLRQLDEIAAALMTEFDLEPNPDTKARSSLRACLGDLPTRRGPRRGLSDRAPHLGDVNIGLIGPGKVADRYLAPAIAQTAGCHLWSVLGRDLDKASAFASRHMTADEVSVKETIDELLDDPDLHAVVIATPDALHADQAIRVVAAGRHVFCEKPLVVDLADGFSLWDAARRAGVVVAVGYQLRWHPAHLRVAELLRSGVIGRVCHARALWTYRAADPQNWRSNREGTRWWAAAAFGTHMLDLLRWLLVPTCGEVRSIGHFRTAATWRSENDETTISTIEFASGATAEITASVTFPSVSRLEIYGERGEILCEGTLAQETGGRMWIGGSEERLASDDMYKREIEDFVAAIREQRQPEADVVEGLRNIQLLGYA